MTTNGKGGPELAVRAREAAVRWGLPYVDRRRKAPLQPLLDAVADAFLVFSHDGVALWDREGSLPWQPGMAHLRVKRIDAGHRDDLLVRMAELEEGDRVIDATLGLGQDALVAARAVGLTGRVVGVEKSLALYAVVSAGLAAHDPGPRSCKVECVHADALDYLSAQADGSADAVVIDPMFGKPRKAQPAFEVLRRFAEHAPLSAELLAQARRVARRVVAVKGAKYTDDFKRLGLEQAETSRYSGVGWAQLRGQGQG